MKLLVVVVIVFDAATRSLSDYNKILWNERSHKYMMIIIVHAAVCYVYGAIVFF